MNNSIEDAFNSSTYLVVEVNTDNLTPDEANQLLMDYGMYAQGEGFKENVSEELYSKLNEQFQAYGIGLELLNDFKPFVIYNMFSQFILESLGYQAKYGVDVYFLERAKISNKTILELETMEFQFSLLSSIPDESIIMGMQYDVDNPETEKYLQDLFDAWITGDPDKMEVIVFEALVEEPGLAPYYEIMYDQRNLSMAQKIEEFLADEAVYFIIVGAGHLVGENGLINLLKNRGYIVEQL
ncbi:MAG: hypothetical protein A2Y89_06445 [Chloroflexi bacterium RBG_13_51_18]|nr:MAG: hypothetical protein A2Y89_06445 [Chloroflexi bacterium RBG_13_51_18]